MSAMGVKAEQLGRYLDIVAQTQASANTTADGMLEAYIGAGGMFKSFNTPLEESAALLGILANRGIKGSEAGTSLNSILINLMGTTKRTSAALQQLGVKAYDDNGNFRGVETTLRDVKDAMVGLTDEQEDMLSANLGGKTQIDTLKALLSGLGEEYDTLKTKVTNSDGALNRMAETMQDNLKGQWTRLKSAIEGAQIELGEKLAPYMKQFVTWFTSKIPEIKEGILSFVDYLSKNTDKLISLGKTAVTVTGSIMALSLASKTLGAINGVTGFISSVRAIQTGAEAAASSLSLAGLAAKALPLLFSPVGLAITAGVAATAYGVHEYNKLMDESILTAKEDLDPIERFIDSITGNKHKTKKELQDLGLLYSDFGSDVSDSFKDAAKEASKSLLEIEMNINRLGRNGGIKTDNMDAFKNYVNEFTNSGINEMKARRDEIKQELTKTFSLDGVVSESEQGTLDGLNRFYEEGINKQLEIRDEIYNIGDAAIKDHGAILDSDMAQIKEKLAELQSLKLEYANAKSAGETAYASSKFKSEAEKVTGLEGASELLQSRIKDRDDKISEAKANYDGSIAEIQYLMDHTTNETDKANYQKTMDDLQKTRDESIQQAMDSYKSDLETFYESNGEYKGKINEETGNIFTKNELKSQGVMQKQEDTHSGLSDIKESGVYALQNSVTGNLDTLYVNVDEKTKEIKGIINGTTGDIGAYSDQQKEKLQNLQQEYSNTGSAIQELVSQHAMYNSTTGEIIGATGNVVSALENVQIAADGTITGITTINGTPIEITSNVDGTIIKMQAVTEAAESVPTDTTANVDTNAADASQQLDGVTESANAIPPDTPANVSTNAGEQKGVVDSLLSSLREIGGHVWSGIVNITKNVAEKFSSSDDSGSVSENASGTDYATSGLSTVNERGWELSDRTVPIIGGYNNNPLVNLQSGTKIRSHMDSMNDMRSAVKEEVSKQVPHGTYQVAQPQVQIAGGGNIDMGGININVDGNQNVEAMINQAMLQFGNTLRQAFSNIKK